MTTAIDLDRALVADHMHVGVLVCAPEASLVDVAGMMAEHRVHCVVVLGDGEGAAGWSVVSDLDVAELAAGGSLEGGTAANCAASPTVVVHPGDSLTRAAQLMAANGVNSTPTFFVGTKGKLGPLAVTALEVGQFTTALDKLVNAK